MALVAVSILWYHAQSHHPLALSPSIYSPAQDAVEYELKVFFGSGLFDSSRYKGLSDEVDRAWQDLYADDTYTKITRNEALLLPNKTSPIRTEPGYYYGGLEVFHQLHCLDTIRQARHPEKYPNMHFTEAHISHCVDIIRQSLMCNADISVFSWLPSTELGPLERLPNQPFSPYFSHPHRCKNFEKLKAWSRSRRVNVHDLDLSLENDLPDPPILW